MYKATDTSFLDDIQQIMQTAKLSEQYNRSDAVRALAAIFEDTSVPDAFSLNDPSELDVDTELTVMAVVVVVLGRMTNNRVIQNTWRLRRRCPRAFTVARRLTSGAAPRNLYGPNELSPRLTPPWR